MAKEISLTPPLCDGAWKQIPHLVARVNSGIAPITCDEETRQTQLTKKIGGFVALAVLGVPWGVYYLAGQPIGGCAGSTSLRSNSSGTHYTCVWDGDTMYYEGVRYELEGFDAPEARHTRCGGDAERELALQARSRVVGLLNENEWDLRPSGHMTESGREFATLLIGGEDVGDILIREGLARPLPDGEEFWCN